ncbi:hypothetical protein [Streptomyces olivaceoviridis]|uniref:hypothetical protein n=1 Tax=Streptomyces olivaceoviridis TaxID=1921 RepID=UPI00332E2911
MEGSEGVVVWAPEFRTLPAWAADADLMVAEALLSPHGPSVLMVVEASPTLARDHGCRLV